jgi:hypothetical protein
MDTDLSKVASHNSIKLKNKKYFASTDVFKLWYICLDWQVNSNTSGSRPEHPTFYCLLHTCVENRKTATATVNMKQDAATLLTPRADQLHL